MEIITGTPVNATTAKQMGKGEHWAPKIDLKDWYENCPPLADTAVKSEKQRRNPEFIDFTGRTFRRLTVVGLMEKKSDWRASWVCRCVCGGYCTRSSKSLKVMARDGNSAIYECGRCDYLHKLQRGWVPRVKDTA